MKNNFSTDIKKVLLAVAVFFFIVAVALGGALADRLFVIKPLDYFTSRKEGESFRVKNLEQQTVKEESVVISITEEVSPSVVTVTIQTPARRILEFNPFGGFSSRIEGGQPQDIGTGFVVAENGLIVTNRHVVENADASYKVVTKDDKEYEVIDISRDPSNDIAILKIDASDLKPVELGESAELKVGQFVIAIGTALGEFRHTVTTGVISGLGRGITAGSVYEGHVERLDDVIQTDAAINPGNSGGPLLNSSGKVIGVSVAVVQGAENIGFAIPIDIVKQGLEQFNQTGRFVSKPFLGVEYQMISKKAAILNDVPEGAYVIRVVPSSPAENAGVKPDDILLKIDGKEINEENGGLAVVISDKKPGDIVTLEMWREEEIISSTLILSEFSK